MTRYTAVWHDEAPDLLTRVWLDARDRDMVTEATHAIDLELALDPDSKGTEVEGDLREWIAPPLRVLFAASEPDRLVKVVHVEVL